ncbi:hypothetical protein ACX27_07365 [Nostoc piscinale CENA21]|uniref:Uncharacterized protein n=1 Tax=Nostoc piscinale CENA21 TaxID=224013 RepID=A0A0M5MI15_9NOSO|nr:hypothetical protein [Nostoc piscinale]ALF52712.1 hypothetical protein ACX27_07365 [Nostoc piscinale CENA21]
MKKNFLLAAFTLGAASLANTLFSAPVRALDVEVKLQVEVPEVIYIQTYESLTFRPTSEEYLGSAAPVNDTVGFFSSDGTITPLPDPSGDLTPTTGDITTGNILVYRIWGTSSGTGGQIQHSVEINGGNTGTLYLDGDTTSAANVGVTINALGGTATAPGLNTSADPIEGSIAFTFNFANASSAGTYSNPNQPLTITATGI